MARYFITVTQGYCVETDLSYEELCEQVEVHNNSDELLARDDVYAEETHYEGMVDHG